MNVPLSIQLNKLGPDHVDVARTYHSMGNLYSALSDQQQAKGYVAIRLNKLGPNHVDVTIGRTYRSLGDVQSVFGMPSSSWRIDDRVQFIQPKSHRSNICNIV